MTETSTTLSSNVSGAELDESSLDAIRSILTEDVVPRETAGAVGEDVADIGGAIHVPHRAPKIRRKADGLPPLAKVASDPKAAALAAAALAPKRAKRGFSLRRKSAEVKRPKKVPEPQVEAPVAQGGLRGGVLERLTAYRPAPAHIAFGLFALLVLFRPWLVLGLTLLSALTLFGVFLILGYDGFWRSVMKIGRWYANHRPSRAAALHIRLDKFAVRWDSILDRFPEGSVDGLYLPDFGELANAEARHDEAMERRLSGLQDGGA